MTLKRYCSLSNKRQRELCLKCTMPDCRPELAGCLIKQEVNENNKKQYWSNPEKYRSANRKSNMKPDEYEKKKEYNRRRYHELKNS